MNVQKQKGFSLVELMVSITIGLILLAGVLSIFFSSRVTFSTNERTARLQENGRVALDLMTHDIRSAGYQGCARGVPINNRLATPIATTWNYIFPVQGSENTAGVLDPVLGVTLSPAVVDDSDVIVVRAATRDGRSTRLETSMGSLTDALTVLNTGTGTLGAGVYMISDCNAADIFQVTGYTPGTPNSTMAHAIGAAPGNQDASLGYLYQAGARIVPLQTIIYYVGLDPATNEPALYRKLGNIAASQLLIEGVQALQISYGEDTDNDRVANLYRPASSVVNWNSIISVNLSMLIRSEEYGTNIDRRSYTLLTTAVGGKVLAAYNDRRQRMMFTTTAALRNRAW